MIETMTAKYLAFMVHNFWNGLVLLLKLERLSDEELETIYALGYNFFTCGKYDVAKNIFSMLTTIEPYTAYYWRALGAVNQQMKNYAEAIAAYDMAVANDETDVISLVYRAESQILSGHVEAGMGDLKAVVNIGAMYPKWEPWVRRANLLLRLHDQS